MRRNVCFWTAAILLVHALGCASFKRSFTVDPQAVTATAEPDPTVPAGLSYNHKAGEIWIGADVSDYLLLCIPAPSTRYQDQRPTCVEVSAVRGYIGGMLRARLSVPTPAPGTARDGAAPGAWTRPLASGGTP